MNSINEPRKDKGDFLVAGCGGCNLDMLGKRCVSNEINSIHFDSRFRSDDKLQSERVTE